MALMGCERSSMWLPSLSAEAAAKGIVAGYEGWAFEDAGWRRSTRTTFLSGCEDATTKSAVRVIMASMDFFIFTNYIRVR